MWYVWKIIDTWTSTELKKKLLENEHTLGEFIEACQVDEEISKQSQLILSKAVPETINKISNLKTRLSNNGDLGRLSGRVIRRIALYAPFN